MDDNDYLVDIPQENESWGLCKVLLCRREAIHIKHLFTEVFIRKSINIDEELDFLGMSYFDYTALLTNRLRKIYKISREYSWCMNEIVNFDRQRFFPSIESMQQLKTKIILDFDGVITKSSFKELYELCIQRCETVVCSANPTITNDWFIKNNLSLPHGIYSNKGKLKKIKKLIDLINRNDFLFYVDDEEIYLKYAYIFGINTYIYQNGKIKYFTLQNGR